MSHPPHAPPGSTPPAAVVVDRPHPQMPLRNRDALTDVQEQTLFRVVLNAMAYPGRLWPLPPMAAALATPGLTLGAAMVLATLADRGVAVAVHGLEVASDLGRQLGVGPLVAPEAAALAVAPIAHAAGLLGRLPQGDVLTPEAGATLVALVAPLLGGRACAQAPAWRVEGPGVDGAVTLRAAGLETGLVATRAALAGTYPAGIDILLAADDALVGLPRTARLCPADPPAG